MYYEQLMKVASLRKKAEIDVPGVIGTGLGGAAGLVGGGAVTNHAADQMDNYNTARALLKKLRSDADNININYKERAMLGNPTTPIIRKSEFIPDALKNVEKFRPDKLTRLLGRNKATAIASVLGLGALGAGGGLGLSKLLSK